ncbi:glycosyltransferase family 8 protein [Phanerochaete sordida]|uniref:Glycosyltransferase family 8 protein n=1 Tax=Phanerochaete sordida TaxID=48140 RepID=A0A9P3GKQ5_9APHY|nr:glycosyltransferase family 8 protein [Phanerochaete sordida]
MPTHSRQHSLTSPFLEGPPVTPWRTKATELRRRSTFLKRIAFLAIVSVFAVPIWILGSQRPPSRIHEAAQDSVAPQPAAPAQHKPVGGLWHHAHRPQTAADDDSETATSIVPLVPVRLPAVHDDSGLVPEEGAIQSQPGEEEEPVTFSLLMWSEASASEGVILLKSIFMYASGPTHIHIICDEAAHSYLEKRLALVTRPRHDILVRFYRPSYEAMAERVEREGAISTIHSAGIVGLMKLFIHEILPPTVKKSIFVDTDAFFISDPRLLWEQFRTWGPDTAISMPSHPDMSSAPWRDANKICSCVMLLDLARLRALRLMDSSAYRAAGGPAALSPPAFAALFGAPDPATGKYRDAWLGDQSYWWAVVKARPDLYAHLSYDWEVSSCLVDMYITGLGDADMPEDEQARVQTDRVKDTPHAGQAVVPRLLHFNCLPVDNYYEWDGWNDPKEGLNKRWGAALRYHTGYKWTWLNQSPAGETALTIETVDDVQFADVASAPTQN